MRPPPVTRHPPTESVVVVVDGCAGDVVVVVGVGVAVVVVVVVVGVVVVVVVVVGVVVVVVGVVVVVVTQTMWRWSHCPLGSQPAVVHGSLSVSGHGVLFGFDVSLQAPVFWSHTESTQTVDGQLQSGIELDCWPPDVSPLSQLASFCDVS